MKITFANSFFDSLKEMSKHDTWWYKTYSLFKYDIPRFIENIWLFRKALWNYRWFDRNYLFMFMTKALSDMADNTEKKGWEIDKTRIKKVDKMFRAARILDNIVQHNYTEMAEKQLGKELKIDWDITEEGELVFTTLKKQEKINKQIRTLADKLEEEEWKELWRIFQGQDHKEYSKLIKGMNAVEQMEKDVWGDWFDGTGAKNWWD